VVVLDLCGESHIWHLSAENTLENVHCLHCHCCGGEVELPRLRAATSWAGGAVGNGSAVRSISCEVRLLAADSLRLPQAEQKRVPGRLFNVHAGHVQARNVTAGEATRLKLGGAVKST